MGSRAEAAVPGSADDSRDLSEYEAPAEAADDDSFLDEPPVVRLTFHEQDFAVFPSQRDDSPGVYVDGEQGLVKVAAPELHVPADAFWEPLECFFSALRVPEALGEFLKPLSDAGVDIFHCSTRRFWEPEFAEIDGAEGLNFAGWPRS